MDPGVRQVTDPEASRPARIMIIDPDQTVRRDVKAACQQDGYEVLEGDGLTSALHLVEEEALPSLMIVEVVLPDGSGFDVCREVRRIDASLPIIMISSRTDEIDVVVGLEIGADDYVAKPLRLRELLARIAAHLRKVRLETTETNRSRLEFKDLVIDVNERRVYKEGRQVDLTHTEFDLLAFLAGHAGKVLSREKILNRVWGYEYPIETRVIDVHIRNLRRKIESQSSRPFYILAVPGIGYRFTNAKPD